MFQPVLAGHLFMTATVGLPEGDHQRRYDTHASIRLIASAITLSVGVIGPLEARVSYLWVTTMDRFHCTVTISMRYCN